MDQCYNVSAATVVTAKTLDNLPSGIILQNAINLSNYPNKRYIAQAKDSILIDIKKEAVLKAEAAS